MKKDLENELGLCSTCKHCIKKELIGKEERIKYKCKKPMLKNLNMGEVLHCIYYEEKGKNQKIKLTAKQQKEVNRLLNRKGGLYEKK